MKTKVWITTSGDSKRVKITSIKGNTIFISNEKMESKFKNLIGVVSEVIEISISEMKELYGMSEDMKIGDLGPIGLKNVFSKSC